MEKFELKDLIPQEIITDWKELKGQTGIRIPEELRVREIEFIGFFYSQQLAAQLEGKLPRTEAKDIIRERIQKINLKLEENQSFEGLFRDWDTVEGNPLPLIKNAVRAPSEVDSLSKKTSKGWWTRG